MSYLDLLKQKKSSTPKVCNLPKPSNPSFDSYGSAPTNPTPENRQKTNPINLLSKVLDGEASLALPSPDGPLSLDATSLSLASNNRSLEIDVIAYPENRPVCNLPKPSNPPFDSYGSAPINHGSGIAIDMNPEDMLARKELQKDVTLQHRDQQQQSIEPVTPDERALVRSWLLSIGECEISVIQQVLDQCSHDKEARAYYLRRANGLPS